MDVTRDGVQHQRLQLSGLAADAQAARGVVRQIVLQALADRLRLGGPVRAHSSASRASSWRSIALPMCSTVCRRGCRYGAAISAAYLRPAGISSGSPSTCTL